MTKAIIFDAEGVIVDSEAIWDLGQKEFLARRGLAYDRARLKPLMTGVSLADGVRVMQRELGFGGDPEELAKERLAIVEKLFAEKLRFIEGFPEFYARVRDKYKTAVATSMADRLLSIVDGRLGLVSLFDGHVYSISHVAHRSKPHPDIFLHAAGRLGVDPESCLVIEDAPYGVEAARRAGMACVALTTTYGRPLLDGADLIVDSFEEIEPDRIRRG